MTCAPYDYVCRIQEAGGAIGIGGVSTGATAPASTWWKIAVGIAVLAVIIDVYPKLGGWLLLLIVLGLALTGAGRAIITGK